MNTTFRHHSLFILANKAVEEAQEARHAAYLAADANPSRENIKRFLEADKAFHQAEKNLKDVRGLKKYMHGTAEA
jgi:hypothetical protein